MSKITVDLNFTLEDPSGVLRATPEKERMAGFILANAMQTQAGGPVLKFWDWSCAFAKGQPIEVDQTDYQTLYDWVDKCQLFNLVKAQVMLAMIKAKEKSEKIPPLPQ